MDFNSPQVVNIAFNYNNTIATCDVQFEPVGGGTPPGNGMVMVKTHIPTGEGDPLEAVFARAITVAREAVRGATNAP
jgi:hypothetical protein